VLLELGGEPVALGHGPVLLAAGVTTLTPAGRGT
jgi:hypothetical protein